MVKNPPATSGDVSSISGLGTSPGEGNSNPLQYSCLGNPMDRGVWWATVYRVTKQSDMTDGLKYKRPTLPRFSGIREAGIQSHSQLLWPRDLGAHLSLLFLTGK